MSKKTLAILQFSSDNKYVLTFLALSFLSFYCFYKYGVLKNKRACNKPDSHEKMGRSEDPNINKTCFDFVNQTVSDPGGPISLALRIT